MAPARAAPATPETGAQDVDQVDLRATDPAAAPLARFQTVRRRLQAHDHLPKTGSAASARGRPGAATAAQRHGLAWRDL
jgi:hypothetical protein